MDPELKKMLTKWKGWNKQRKTDPTVYVPYSQLNYPQGFMKLSSAPKWFRDKYNSK